MALFAQHNDDVLGIDAGATIHFISDVQLFISWHKDTPIATLSTLAAQPHIAQSTYQTSGVQKGLKIKILTSTLIYPLTHLQHVQKRECASLRLTRTIKPRWKNVSNLLLIYDISGPLMKLAGGTKCVFCFIRIIKKWLLRKSILRKLDLPEAFMWFCEWIA